MQGGHIFYGSGVVLINRYKTVRTTKEKSIRTFVFKISSVTEFCYFQIISLMISLHSIGLDIKSYQTLIGTDPKILFPVFKNAMNRIIEKTVGLVIYVIIVIINTRQSEACTEPMSRIIFQNSKDIVYSLAFYSLIKQIGFHLPRMCIDPIGSVSAVAKPHDGITFLERDKKVVGCAFSLIQDNSLRTLHSEGTSGTI